MRQTSEKLQDYIGKNSQKIYKLENSILNTEENLKEQMAKSFEKVDIEIKELNDGMEKIGKINKDIKEIHKQSAQFSKDFTPKNLHQELKERMDQFSEIEHVNKLNFYYLPMMRDHAMKIDR